jgi:uncharacterized protein (DUF983 family)
MHRDEEEPENRSILPHADFGASDCCGCLVGIIHGGQARIECNECGTVVRTVAPADLQRTLDEMEISLAMCTEMCPHCGRVNVFAGFSETIAYICEGCGRGVRVGDS